jgi:hypothetical protein
MVKGNHTSFFHTTEVSSNKDQIKCPHSINTWKWYKFNNPSSQSVNITNRRFWLFIDSQDPTSWFLWLNTRCSEGQALNHKPHNYHYHIAIFSYNPITQININIQQFPFLFLLGKNDIQFRSQIQLKEKKSIPLFNTHLINRYINP